MPDIKDLPGLKEKQLIDLGPCRVCGKPQLAGNVPIFYKVTISRGGFDANTIKRRVGLEMVLGRGPLAQIMGQDEDIAKIFDGPHKCFVHEHCAGNVGHLLELMPVGDEDAKDE